jgi:hypothetical protein
VRAGGDKKGQAKGLSFFVDRPRTSVSLSIAQRGLTGNLLNCEFLDEWKDSEYAVALIALIPSHQTRKYTISMDAALMARIDAITKNRSAFFARAAHKCAISTV